ncbi:MAG: hypothetical protein EOO46_22795 [Flavobacterium sp.]|nr:MAG: hypothetical protein EOO46_22795 [Flavobacterium sp.]
MNVHNDFRNEVLMGEKGYIRYSVAYSYRHDPKEEEKNPSRQTESLHFSWNQTKGKRQEDEKRNKWNTEDLRDDMVEKLKENIKKNVSTELYQKMFSFDVRKQTEAIQLLKKCLVQEYQGTVDMLDLIIRWLFFKLWDNSNMQIAKEALDYVYNLVLALEAGKTSLEDFEMNAKQQAL